MTGFAADDHLHAAIVGRLRPSNGRNAFCSSASTILRMRSAALVVFTQPGEFGLAEHARQAILIDFLGVP